MLKKNKRYLAIFILSYLLIALAIILFKRWDIFPWIGDCNPRGYKNGHFMAYCHSTKYGDYEHWAYWHQSDPVSIDAVRQSDVLFLGNSRTQYAFSTRAVSDYFQHTGIRHYVFGFGMGSYMPVPEKMMKKYQLKPKVLVINTDPFFSDTLNETNQQMLKNDFKTRWEFSAKRYMQKLQQRICSSGKKGEYLYNALCLGTGETLYREPEHGHWNTDYYRPNKRIPATYTDALLPSLGKTLPIAERFIAETGLEKSCIILTVTPRKNTPLKFARQLGQKLGTPFVFPMIDGLVTVDESHLDKTGAEKWSRAFLAKAAPIIEACSRKSRSLASVGDTP